MDIELDIFILDDFIRQLGEKGQNHNLQGVDNRMNNVKGKTAILLLYWVVEIRNIKQ